MIHPCVKLTYSQLEACQNNQTSFITKLMNVKLTEFESTPRSTGFFYLAFTIKDIK